MDQEWSPGSYPGQGGREATSRYQRSTPLSLARRTGLVAQSGRFDSVEGLSRVPERKFWLRLLTACSLVRSQPLEPRARPVWTRRRPSKLDEASSTLAARSRPRSGIGYHAPLRRVRLPVRLRPRTLWTRTHLVRRAGCLPAEEGSIPFGFARAGLAQRSVRPLYKRTTPVRPRPQYGGVPQVETARVQTPRSTGSIPVAPTTWKEGDW